MSVIRKKVGQVWQLNYHQYPLSPGVYTITELPVEEDAWGSKKAIVISSNDGRTRQINRRNMTTSKGMWTYVGLTTDVPKPWVLSCRRCQCKEIVISLGPPPRQDCKLCGGHNALRI